MNKKNFASKLLALMLLVLMALSLAACGGEDGGTGVSGEPKNAQEAAKVQNPAAQCRNGGSIYCNVREIPEHAIK